MDIINSSFVFVCVLRYLLSVFPAIIEMPSTSFKAFSPIRAWEIQNWGNRQDWAIRRKMMSGVELNALINQIQAGSNDGQAVQLTENSQITLTTVNKTEKNSKSYNNYNREIWRVQGGILESSLVDFCVQRTRSKFIDDISK